MVDTHDPYATWLVHHGRSAGQFSSFSGVFINSLGGVRPALIINQHSN
ncbi:hypothetical protein [Lactococcus formosensis]